MDPRAVEQPTVHVGRQVIFDQYGEVFACELLFRGAPAQVTSLFVRTFTDFGLPELVGNRPCLVTVPRDFLVGDLPMPFDPGQVILEVVVAADLDDAVLTGIEALAAGGFTIAVTAEVADFSDRLLPVAAYLKINLPGAAESVMDLARTCHERHPHLRLIAAQLETEAQKHRAPALGFSLFQGSVLGRPHVVSMAELSPARLSRLRLVSVLAAAEVDFDEAVSLIPGDPALTYRLLQASNAAASGLPARVSSVREAAVLLGLPTIRHWVTLMLLSDLSKAREEQLIPTMIRARMCQSVAEQAGLPGDAAFCVGLLAGIAELIGQSRPALAQQLPLTDEVNDALADGAGPLGHLLAAVRDYETGDPSGLAELVDPGAAVHAYLAATAWCNQVMGAAGPVERQTSARRPRIAR
ncbi:EAL and HDOD domain-containing protein [Actinoplanes friuliensis]|uniref:HDOD domain-containing protein n=1 Tax=Actinoplanes friuliensis DSM 7358 TaxID=1246995 RepID=U5VWN0_9ACTN|nr:HDOD domain-containing protein [Actinoplanes friuliensis]AGZ41279.1 hypothetical protein AFR_14985 [Actinoplanes friuliensis DSM 7358]